MVGGRKERECIFLGREPAQPDGAVSRPCGTQAVAERYRDDGNPKRDMANDSEALRTELTE